MRRSPRGAETKYESKIKSEKIRKIKVSLSKERERSADT